MNNMVNFQHWLAQHMYNMLQKYQFLIWVDFSHFLLHMFQKSDIFPSQIRTTVCWDMYQTVPFHSQHFHALHVLPWRSEQVVVFFIEHIAASYSVSPFTHEQIQVTGVCHGYHRSCPKPRQKSQDVTLARCSWSSRFPAMSAILLVTVCLDCGSNFSFFQVLLVQQSPPSSLWHTPPLRMANCF